MIECHECGRVPDNIDDHEDGCPVPERIRDRRRDWVESIPKESRRVWAIDGKINGVSIDDDGNIADEQ